MRQVARTPRRRALVACAIWVGCTALHPHAGGAQQGVWRASSAPAEPALSLADALRAVLDRGPDLQRAAIARRAEQGALGEASGAFDPAITTQLETQRNTVMSLDDPASGRLSSVLQTQTTTDLAFRIATRAGVVLSPEVLLTRTGTPVGGLPPTTRSTVRLALSVPLLRDWGGAITSAPERAQRFLLSASTEEFRATGARAARDAALAYWNYLAARLRREALAETERHAQRILDETRQLVAADERPAADLKQLAANLVSRRATRIAADQGVLEAYRQLVLVIGDPASSVTTLPRPVTPFPAEPRDSTSVQLPAVALDSAFTRRADLTASEERRRASEVGLVAARSMLRPQLDLAIRTGYSALAQGTGFGRYLDPLYRNLPSPNTIVQATYALPLGNVAAEGRTMQAEADVARAELATHELQRSVEASVRVSFASLQRNAIALRAAHEAVTLWREAISAEEQKFRLGSSTLFDVVQAEDGLVNAQLQEIASARDYAVAIANYRYETGALVRSGTGVLSADVVSLLTPP
jgi:outer membrane protein